MKINLDFTEKDIFSPSAELIAGQSISDQRVEVCLGLAVFLVLPVVFIVLMQAGLPPRLAAMESMLALSVTARISAIWQLKNRRYLILGNLRRHWRLTLQEKDKSVLAERAQTMRHYWKKLVCWDRDWIPGSYLIAVVALAVEGFREHPFPFAWVVLVTVVYTAIILKGRSDIVKELLRVSPNDLKQFIKLN